MGNKMKFAGKFCGRECEYLDQQWYECVRYRRPDGMPMLVEYKKEKGWKRLEECIKEFGKEEDDG